jgi:hypothetical protein
VGHCQGGREVLHPRPARPAVTPPNQALQQTAGRFLSFSEFTLSQRGPPLLSLVVRR